MSFSVQLTPDLIPVEPGATTPVTVAVINKSDEADRFELEIEGVDIEWTAVPVPIFAAEPNETHTERIFFKPSRTSESLAGNYPFAVRVRSLQSGESKTIQAVLEVKPFNHVTMDISPKKGSFSVWRKNNSFSAVIVNLGNSEHTLRLIGNDPEDSCAYEFESEQVSVAPGQQKEVEFVATPTVKPVFAGSKLIGFSVAARSVDHPSVVSTAQAQLEQRPLLTPTSLILSVIVVVVLGLWYFMRPQPLDIVTFSVNPHIVQIGDQVTVSWNVAQATHVRVTAGTDVVSDGTDFADTSKYTLTTSGDVHFAIVANKDDQVRRQDVILNVKEPVTQPDPEILSLQAKPTRIKLSSSFELDYKFGPSVVKAVLEPVGTALDTTLSRMDVTPTRSGDLEYTVAATNKDGKTITKSVMVSVYEESDATIIAFTANNTSIPASLGRVTLNWQVSGAVRVELALSQDKTQVVDSSSSIDLPIQSKTTYLLVAYDQKGRKATKTLTVDVVPDAPPPDQGNPPGSGGTAGNPTTGGKTTGGGTTTSGDTGR